MIHIDRCRGPRVALLALLSCQGRLDVTDADIAGAAGEAGYSGSGHGAGAAGSGEAMASCRDGVRNGTEEAVDCGGPNCGACPESPPCTNGTVECDSHVCSGGVCQPPRCDDGVRNGDEQDIDCGGDCSACLTLCNSHCAVSASLIPVGCDPQHPAATGIASIPRPNADGSVIAFDLCSDSRCSPYHWTSRDGARAFTLTGGATLAGMSDDGALLLVSPRVALGAESLLMAPDGTSVPTGMATAPALLGADGAIVGVSAASQNSLALLRRRRDGEIESLGELPFAADLLALTGATPDASMIVGFSENQSFRYSDSEGLQIGLESLPGSADGSMIQALSRDGRSFAGLTSLGGRRLSVFRWTPAGGVEAVAPAIARDTPGVDPYRMALSDDGSVLAFSGETGGGAGEFAAFRWTEATGAEVLTPGIRSVASLVSGDGRVIVGHTDDDPDYSAFIWTEAAGPRSVRAALEASGVDFTGWALDAPIALSRNGRVALGTGACGGIPTLYRLVLPE